MYNAVKYYNQYSKLLFNIDVCNKHIIILFNYWLIINTNIVKYIYIQILPTCSIRTHRTF